MRQLPWRAGDLVKVPLAPQLVVRRTFIDVEEGGGITRGLANHFCDTRNIFLVLFFWGGGGRFVFGSFLLLSFFPNS